jgi:hypothetical protein
MSVKNATWTDHVKGAYPPRIPTLVGLTQAGKRLDLRQFGCLL